MYIKEEEQQQYILTLNRDKIENEERIKDINIDIKTNKVTTFTKKKFVKHYYREK